MQRGHVLVGVDGSAESDAAVAWAVREARARGCSVRIVHCCESRYYGLWTTTRSLREGLRAMARPLVDAAVELALGLDPQVPVQGQVLVAAPGRALVRLSRNASIVVVGRSGRGAISHLLLGSVARHVIAAAQCPVVSVGSSPDGAAGDTHVVAGTTRVVAAVDRSVAHEQTLRFAFDEARLHGVPLRVVTSPDRSDAGPTRLRELAGTLIAWQQQYPTVKLTTSVLAGNLADALGTLCTPHDLLVLGHRRHGTLLAELPGGRIAAAMHAVRCAIAVVDEPPTIAVREPSTVAATSPAAESESSVQG